MYNSTTAYEAKIRSGVHPLCCRSVGNEHLEAGAGDNVHIYTLNAANGTWQVSAELALDHVAGLGLVVQPPTGERIPVNERVSISPYAAGVVEHQVTGRVVVKQGFERHLLGHALFFPALQTVVAELALEQRDARLAGIGVTQLARRLGHLVIRHQRMDAIRNGHRVRYVPPQSKVPQPPPQREKIRERDFDLTTNG